MTTSYKILYIGEGRGWRYAVDIEMVTCIFLQELIIKKMGKTLIVIT